jgi:hypothetical protein
MRPTLLRGPRAPRALALLLAAAWAAAADLPDDASKALEAFEHKSCDIAKENTAAKDKLRKQLDGELAKAAERESKAKHYGPAREIERARAGIAEAAAAEAKEHQKDKERQQ